MSRAETPRIRPSGDVKWGIPEETAQTPPAAAPPKYTRLSATDIRTVLELHDRGTPQVDIAKVIGKSQSAVCNALKAFDADAKAVARQLRAFTDESISDWRRAKRIAAKRGDHRPARELLEAAYPDLRPHPANHGTTGGVTVIVAVPHSQHNPLPTVDSTSNMALPTMVSSQGAMSEGRGLEIAAGPGSSPYPTFASDVSTVSKDLHRLTEAPRSHNNELR